LRSLLSGAALLALLGFGAPSFAADARMAPATERQGRDTQNAPDLVIHQVGLTPTGSVVYQVANRGHASTQAPFVVDIYLSGVRADTIRHEPLGAMSMQTVESNRARFSDCKGGTVRLVVDALNTVREADDKNNERVMQLAPSCPKTP
jgi:hypothetical protein